MKTKTGQISDLDLLTPEQRRKVLLVGEALDTKGVVRIFKVKDQTIFDYLYMLDMIDTSQHEAAHHYLLALESWRIDGLLFLVQIDTSLKSVAM